MDISGDWITNQYLAEDNGDGLHGLEDQDEYDYSPYEELEEYTEEMDREDDDLIDGVTVDD